MHRASSELSRRSASIARTAVSAALRRAVATPGAAGRRYGGNLFPRTFTPDPTAALSVRSRRSRTADERSDTDSEARAQRDSPLAPRPAGLGPGLRRRQVRVLRPHHEQGGARHEHRRYFRPQETEARLADPARRSRVAQPQGARDRRHHDRQQRAQRHRDRPQGRRAAEAAHAAVAMRSDASRVTRSSPRSSAYRSPTSPRSKTQEKTPYQQRRLQDLRRLRPQRSRS